MPAVTSEARRATIAGLARSVDGLGRGRMRVAVDGHTASGKTTFAHELAAELRLLGRPTLRASLDDFKKPWRDAEEKGYDRLSGEGYYRRAPDFAAARELLLEPAGPSGSGIVVLCAHDALTGLDHRQVRVEAPHDAVLVVDSVFAMRPEYDECWEFTIWLDVSPDVAVARGVDRDSALTGRSEAERLLRDRYLSSEQIYIAEVDPVAKADVVVDNTDFSKPIVTRSDASR